jgi:thiol-disulfide isomerase/thioredoxin
MLAIIGCLALLIIAGLVWAFWPRASYGYQESVESEEILGNFPPVAPMEVDLPAPELTLSDLEGKSVSLSDYPGQVILVNIWAIWCTPCRAELPTLQAYYEDHRNQNFVVIGIDTGDDVEDIAYHVKLFKLTFPNWQDHNQAAPRAFNITFLPSSYVIDRTGRIRLTWSGAIQREALEQYITPLLEE